MAIPVPSDVTVTSSRDRFELAIERWFTTFGTADRALRVRIEPDRVSWSRYPTLGTIRFDEQWDNASRAVLRRFDWRWFERGTRATRDHQIWTGPVLVATDGSELDLRHRFGVEYEYGAVMTTLLQWGHDVGVSLPGDAAPYRGGGKRPEWPRLAIIRATWLGGEAIQQLSP